MPLAPGTAASAPSLLLTVKVTSLPANGLPSPFRTCTTRGSGSSWLTGPLCALPPWALISGPVASTCWTLTEAVASLASASRATARRTVADSAASGTPGAKKVPFVPMPTSTAAATPFTSTVSPAKPESTSDTRPATSTASPAAVPVSITRPSGG